MVNAGVFDNVKNCQPLLLNELGSRTMNRLKTRSDFGERLYTLRKARRISQRELADEVGVSHVTISQWENSDNTPSGANLMLLTRAIECTPDYLMYGNKSDCASIPLQPVPPNINYPLLTDLQASTWEKVAFEVSSIDSWFMSSSSLVGKGFWLRITGNAMASLSGLGIIEGSLVLFDTAREAAKGDLILVKKRWHSEPMFRQFVIDGGIKYLKALNPAWPVRELDSSYELIGVGVESRQFLIS